MSYKKTVGVFIDRCLIMFNVLLVSFPLISVKHADVIKLG